MIRIPFLSRPGRDKPVPAAGHTPWWVNVLTDWGRPVVAGVVLTMCAPGEHYLARLAGWSDTLAWGMPFVLTAYAGISAVVATKRPRGSAGKRTAVAGAILSILLAMAAQPVAHLYGYEGSWTYRQTLTVIISCIPALVLGHLLHLAVSPGVSRRDVPVPVTEDAGDKPVPAPVPVPAWATEEKARRSVPVPPVSRPAAPPAKVSLSHPGRPAARPVPAPVSLGDRVSMSSRAVVLLSRGQDEDTVKDTLRTEFTGADGVPPKANSINKAVTRAQDKVSRAS